MYMSGIHVGLKQAHALQLRHFQSDTFPQTIRSRDGGCLEDRNG